MEKQIVLLFSPGLDSYLANRILLKREDISLHRIYFKLNSVYTKPEENFLLDKYSGKCWNDVIFSSMLNIKYVEKFDAYVPNRNLMFVTAASAKFPYAGEIYINGMKDDRVSDNNRELFEEYSKTLSKSIGHKVEIKSLFWDIEKGEAVKNYINEGGQILNLVKNTYSCFSNVFDKRVYNVYHKQNDTYTYFGGVEITGCLTCKACFRKICALTEGNIYIPFLNKEVVEWYTNNVDEYEHPVRFKTIQNYSKFLKYYEKEERFTI